MKKAILFSIILIVSSQVIGQAGYMGKKRLIEANVSSQIGYFFRGGQPTWNKTIHYEMVTSPLASWSFGFGWGLTTITKWEMSTYSQSIHMVRQNPSTGWEETLWPVGTMQYNHQEVSIQRRWYLADLGSVAPYGVFVGLETDIARAKQTTSDLSFHSDYDNEDLEFEAVKSRAQYALSELFVIGNRRMLQRRISCGLFLKTGYVLFQTSRPSIYTSSKTLVNHMDVQENMMMRHYAMSKVMQIGAHLGFLF